MSLLGTLMKILAFNRHYLPGYKGGGPIRSLANMVDALGEELEFNVVTLDRDLGDSSPYSDISYDWFRLGNANVRYLKKTDVALSTIRSLCAEIKPDVIYLNSYLDPLFTARIMLARKSLGAKIILAPRGEFSPGALAQKSLKKRVYIGAWKLFGMHRKVVWHASTPIEANEISAVFPEARIVVAPDLGGAPKPVFWEPREKDTPLRVCFLSRISPMKNLLGAISALTQVKTPVIFNIYGPIEDEAYWAKCLKLAETLPNHVKMEYKGQVRHDDVAQTIGQHDLFFLPSLGENYGHVFPEALGAGVPVLTSDRTPWNDLEDQGVGWSLPLNDDFAARLDLAASWTNDELLNIREACIAYAIRTLQSNEALEQNRAVFRNHLQDVPK